jgi:hypothetical protein
VPEVAVPDVPVAEPFVPAEALPEVPSVPLLAVPPSLPGAPPSGLPLRFASCPHAAMTEPAKLRTIADFKTTLSALGKSITPPSL